ncbi:hypothetical protein [Polaribacter sp. Asnod1-A03]|uniref:hypothetical protein n=1 Tax=Polaribacter sp. Asnod1-A03 TaxID=3160581 RepID=UPI0038642915
MKKLDELLSGLSYKYKYFKNELLKNNKNFKVILIPYLLLLIFLGYQLFSRRSNINFFGYTLSIIFFALYLLAIYALTKMILVEFGIIKKNKLDSKFLNSSKQQFRLSEKKYFKPNETTKLQDEVVILNKKTSNNNESIKSVKDDLIKANKNHTDFIKNQFESTENIVNKNASKIVNLNKKTSDNSESIKSVKADLIKGNNNHTKFIKEQFEPIKNITNKNKNEIESLNKKTSNNSGAIKSVKGDLIKGNKNHTDFIKNEFEPTKNIVNKNTSKIETLNKKTSNNNETIKSVEDALIKENKNHIDFLKKEFEPIKNIANRNTTEIIISNNKISDNLNSIKSVKDDLIQNQKEIKKKNSKIETIKILTDNSNNSIEIMLINIKKIFKKHKNLFKNLDVDNFIAMVFNGENKSNPKKLKEEELKNVYAIITLMIKEKKIHSIDSELARILIKYFDLEVTPKTVKNRIAEIKKDQNFLISKINENSIIDKISKI